MAAARRSRRTPHSRFPTRTLPAAFLFLLNSLVFEDDHRERFAVWLDARSMFALDIEGPYYALERSLGATLAGMRNGG
jgi:hypothetical protein